MKLDIFLAVRGARAEWEWRRDRIDRSRGETARKSYCLEVMGWRIAVSVAGTCLVLGLASAQPFRLGHELATSFLARQAHAASNREQITVIHAQAGSAMLIDRRGSESVAYLRGDGSFVWAQIAEQLPEATAQDRTIHVAIRRWRIDSGSCLDLGPRLETFFHELDEALADLDGASTGNDEITLDSAAFSIHVPVKDAQLILAPDGSRDVPLQRAAYSLHSVVSGCTAGVASTVEQHDFYAPRWTAPRPAAELQL